MSEQVILATQLSIREAGYDEYWLQDRIFENPSILGLGELDAIAKEKRQSSGGRLDILLKNPEDDSMYEVEVMLGETDETHIIRTIEYWDNEKRRWPQRQHFAVLVAEHINRRFFNVIHLLSHSIPIIAVQVSLLQNGPARSLYFSTILDTFEEMDDGTPEEGGTFNRDHWGKKAKWTLEAAETLIGVVHDTFPDATLRYVKNYVAISSDGYNRFWLRKRSAGKSLLSFRVDTAKRDEVASIFDAANISYVRRPKGFALTVDRAMLEKNPSLFQAVGRLALKSNDADG